MMTGAEASAALVRGALKAGVEICVYLPDSVMSGAIREFRRNGTLCVPCSREDEGVAVAVGLQLGGRTAVCLMEASGIGLSGLILARAQVQRTPVVIVASHTRGGGERFDYHGATLLCSEGIFPGLGIPYDVANDAASLEDTMERIFATARGQLTSYGLLIPPHLLTERRS